MSIVLEQVSKRYGNQWVVDNVSLEVADKELFVLLGSSGSGKSTILRMIAGLTTPTGGRVFLHGKDVTWLRPQDRGTGFVFQNYSIFRHMKVADNIEFGLRIRKVPKQERREKREQLLDLVGLAGLGNRFPHQLSGGQQQRVALARALVYEPNVLLLDEPFGALDVKIRSQLRRSLREIQRRLGVTTVLVTHDQEEAFELADRIGVLERGRLLEVGQGESLYSGPKTLFAASFLGAGTVLVGRAEKGQARFGDISLEIPQATPHEEGARVQILFRPEQVLLSEARPNDGLPVLGKGTLVEKTFTGALRRARFRLPRPAGTRQLAPALPFGEESLLIDVAMPAEAVIDKEELWLSLRGWTILKQPQPHLLVCDSGEGSIATLVLTKKLAERLRAATTILAVAEKPDAAERLRTTLKQRQQDGDLADAHLQVRYGKVREQIATQQAESLYEMIVIAAQSKPSIRSRVARLPMIEGKAKQLSQTLLSVIQHADVPVLVVKGERAAIERVLICTAAGEPGKSDVIVGGRLARRIGAAATLLYVATRSDEPNSLTRIYLDRAASTLRSLDMEIEVRTRQAETAVSGILEEAKADQSDLIVIGCHGPRLRSRKFYELNRVMMDVIAETDRSVLVVPTDRL